MTPDVSSELAVRPAPVGRLSGSAWIQIGVVAALIAVLYGWVLVDMANDWYIVPAYSQGFLLPPLALYIVWMNRDRTLSIPGRPDPKGLSLIALACFLFLLGQLASEFFLMRFSFVILLAGLVWLFWGVGRLKTLAFPLVVLATMVPLPVVVYNSLAAPLQLLASDLGTRLAQAFGVSAYRDGNIIQLASTSLGVAEACSGLNSLSALIAGSVLLGYAVSTRLLTRVVLVLAAVPLAIAVNILRVAGTAVLADYDEVYAMGFYHSFSGWLVFVAGFAFLYVVARILNRLFD